MNQKEEHPYRRMLKINNIEHREVNSLKQFINMGYLTSLNYENPGDSLWIMYEHVLVFIEYLCVPFCTISTYFKVSFPSCYQFWNVSKTTATFLGLRFGKQCTPWAISSGPKKFFGGIYTLSIQTIFIISIFRHCLNYPFFLVSCLGAITSFFLKKNMGYSY